jgi:two-component system response regulator HydG
LIESELFGHAKNAFTGAVQAKQGLLAIAERGTVFLDEVGELPLDLQPKLLRVLQEKAVRPVGVVKTVPISARILAATNRDLEEATARGTFRRDLYFRLNVLNVRVPSLRERRKDIPVLINHFLERVSRSCGKRYELSDDAMQALVAYDWPGNVRELENCIERCCAMNSGPSLHSFDLPDCITGTRRQSTFPPATRIVRLADMEKDAIVAAIKQLNGDKRMASRLLGIGKTTLYRKLKQYQVSQ